MKTAAGIGAAALGSLLNPGLFRGEAAEGHGSLGQVRHTKGRAKRIIYLFMAGGPSQLELFDYKPKLVELNGQEIPKSYIEGKRFAFMATSHGVKCLGTRRKFARHGQSGAWVSDLFPHTAGIVEPIVLLTFERHTRERARVAISLEQDPAKVRPNDVPLLLYWTMPLTNMRGVMV